MLNIINKLMLPTDISTFFTPLFFSKSWLRLSKTLTLLIGASLVLASCNSEKGSISSEIATGGYVMKGLFIPAEKVCTIEGKQFQDGDFITTETKKANINDKGKIAFFEGMPKGDYYTISCTGFYKDEQTQAPSESAVTLKGFFSKANGVHNINVFTDMIADQEQKLLAEKLSSNATSSNATSSNATSSNATDTTDNATDPTDSADADSNATAFNEVNELVSKSLVKAMKIKPEEADEITDVSKLNSADPQSIGDITLLIANLNILSHKSIDLASEILTVPLRFDPTGTVEASSLGNLNAQLSETDLVIVDEAITTAGVDRADLGELVGEAKTTTDTQQQPATDTHTKNPQQQQQKPNGQNPIGKQNPPANTDGQNPTGKQNPPQTKPAGLAITFTGASSIGSSIIYEANGVVTVKPLMEIPIVPFVLVRTDIKGSVDPATLQFYITSDKPHATPLPLKETRLLKGDKYNKDIVTLFKDRPAKAASVKTKFTICILKTATAGDCTSGKSTSDNVLLQKDFTVERDDAKASFSPASTLDGVPLTAGASGQPASVTIDNPTGDVLLEVSITDFSNNDMSTYDPVVTDGTTGVNGYDEKTKDGTTEFNQVKIPKTMLPLNIKTPLTFCLVPHDQHLTDCSQAIKSAKFTVTTKGNPLLTVPTSPVKGNVWITDYTNGGSGGVSAVLSSTTFDVSKLKFLVGTTATSPDNLAGMTPAKANVNIYVGDASTVKLKLDADAIKVDPATTGYEYHLVYGYDGRNGHYVSPVINRTQAFTGDIPVSNVIPTGKSVGTIVVGICADKPVDGSFDQSLTSPCSGSWHDPARVLFQITLHKP